MQCGERRSTQLANKGIQLPGVISIDCDFPVGDTQQWENTMYIVEATSTTVPPTTIPAEIGITNTMTVPRVYPAIDV